MRKNTVTVAITAASYSGNKGAAAMLQSSIRQLRERYGEQLRIYLMSVYPKEDIDQLEFDHIKVVSTKPSQLLFVAFPLAVLYRILKNIPILGNLCFKNSILRTYADTDLVIDEAGISFVDSRGFVMNTYAFVCLAVPLLMGVPVVKYSQALGTFQNPYNRFLAKWILPKLKLVIARGNITYTNLESIHCCENVVVCADGAFSMQDSTARKKDVQERCRADAFFNHPDLVGLSISSVVQKRCAKKRIDYTKIMIQFVDALNEKGYPVLLIANAARIHSQKPRNNDLMVGDEIYQGITDKTMVRWYHEEMAAEEIREYISKCRFVVASRFHAMIAALTKEIPVLLIGWSHKYQEVLDMFALGSYATDYADLSLDKLMEDFETVILDEDTIRYQLRLHHDEVIQSSKKNIALISQVLDQILNHENV